MSRPWVRLAQDAQDIGLVVTCLRPHLGSGGRAFEVELWEPDGELWARATWATEDLVREIIGKYAEECVHGGRQMEGMLG